MQSKIPCMLGSFLVIVLFCAACRGIPGAKTAMIAAGGGHTRAVKCWGLNENGQLGNGSNQDASVPVDVRIS